MLTFKKNIKNVLIKFLKKITITECDYKNYFIYQNPDEDNQHDDAYMSLTLYRYLNTECIITDKTLKNKGKNNNKREFNCSFTSGISYWFFEECIRKQIPIKKNQIYLYYSKNYTKLQIRTNRMIF